MGALEAVLQTPGLSGEVQLPSAAPPCPPPPHSMPTVRMARASTARPATTATPWSN